MHTVYATYSLMNVENSVENIENPFKKVEKCVENVENSTVFWGEKPE